MMEWLQLLLPAWIMGTLLVFLTAPLGCLMLWRRMSFFADTMAHGTLLGVAIAGAMALPLWMGVAFIAGLLVAILWVLHDPRLPNDALLALCSATLLCSGLMFIQHIPSLRPELLSYLFGDLLTITWADLPVFATVIVVALAVLYKSWQAQIQIAIDPDMAVSEGVSAKWQRFDFYVATGFIYHFGASCSGFFTDGCFACHSSTYRSTACPLSKTNGDLGLCDCANWGDSWFMVQRRAEYLYRTQHCFNHVDSVCVDFYRAEV